MRIRRFFTTEGKSPYEGIAFRKVTSEIRNPDGSIVFQQSDIEVPEGWSQVACDVLAQKYFRRAGVAAILKSVEENDVPSFLWRHVPDAEALGALADGSIDTAPMVTRSVSIDELPDAFASLADPNDCKVVVEPHG